MVNIFGLGIFGALVLTLISIISFYGNYNSINMQTAFAHLNCPMPASTGVVGKGVDSNGNSILVYTNGTYNNPWKGNYTFNTLYYHGSICTNVHTLAGYDYFYGSVGSVSGLGMPIFIGDYLSEAGDKLTNFFYMVSVIMNPAQFSITLDRPYTLADMNITAQGIIYAIYAFSYVGIGAMIYKIASPFSGGG